MLKPGDFQLRSQTWKKNDEAAATSQWEGLAMTNYDGSRPNRGPILPFRVKEP